MIVLFIIYNQSNSKNNSEKNSFQNKLFIKIISVTFIMLVVDIFSRFDGNPGTIYTILNHWGNLIIFLINLVLPSLWLQYVHYQIFQQKLITKKLTCPLLLINSIHIIMVILTQYFGWYYYIDSSNIYHRGPFYLVSPISTIVLLIVAFVLIIVNRKKIEKRYYFALLFFPVPPLICLILQLKFYGISLILNGVVISILIVFLNIQNHNIYTDYLTGVSNRKKLQMYIEYKIKTSTQEKTFSAIMIDLNDFKYINDTYGHEMGDKALQITVELLSSCIRSKDIRSKDFIARYGGDEFWIVLDTSNIIDLEDIVARMISSFEKYNDSNAQPYKLEFSCGYAVYDYNSNMNIEEFQKHIDNLMYENKRAMKEKKSQGTKNLL